LAAGHARHVFVLLHPPVVPFGARSLWRIYARPGQEAQRKRLLDLLGRYHAIVLSAHLHRYGVVARKTEPGRFVQLAVNSVIPSADVAPSHIVSGTDRYGPDLVDLEPKFEPQTRSARRDALREEAPFIDHYEYADAPGYAVITVQGNRVQAEIYAGLGRRLWKQVDLSGLLVDR
jgi:hypothetical protein